MFIYKKQNITINNFYCIFTLMCELCFLWKCCLIETWRTGYEKELWKTYVVSMPSAVIIIILGQTLSDRIVWGSPQRRLGEKCSLKLQCLWFKGNPRVKNNNLVLFGCNIKSHTRGYFITNNNLVDKVLFSFRFVNNIPAGMAKRKRGPISAVAVRENVWEPLKLGLIRLLRYWLDQRLVQQQQ